MLVLNLRRFAILLIGVFWLQSPFAQVSTRLEQDWEFLRSDLGGIWEAIRPVPAGGPESVPIWEKTSLPHCVNAYDATDPDLNYYQGPAWYRTKLRINNPYTDGRTLLHFEGAGQKTAVYIYDSLVGTHTGGYDEFTIDITGAVAAFLKRPVAVKQFKGLVPVSIRTDNSRDLEMIPSSMSDFNVYGGIYRYLNLVYVPALSIEHLFVKAATDNNGRNGTVTISPRFYNPDRIANALLDISITDPAGREVYTHKSGYATDNSEALPAVSLKKPSLWSPGQPALYTISVRIGDYVRQEKFAFRFFEFVKQGPFMLNGKRLLLKGTHRHEDHAGVAAAMTEEQMRAEMVLMKEMGVNFIRLGHYQQSRIILNLCDSLGILVWEEIPWCRGGLGGEIYKGQARRMLTNMIEQHFNHPSVIIWGLGNENDWAGDFPVFDTLQIRAFMQELNDISHKMDPSRKTAIRRCDFCRDIVDVYSPSIWAGWYRGIYTEYKGISETEMKKVDHFLHVEWGGDSHAGRHSETPDNGLQKIKASGNADERAGDAALVGGAARASKDGDWSESYMVNLVDWHLKEQETMPWLTGTAQWPFKDFSTPLRPDNPVPYVNQKGVVERDLTRKETYYVYQSYWSTQPMIHIYGNGWPVRWGAEGEEKMVKVFSNMESAELFVNGKSLGIKKRDSQDFPAAGLRWTVPMNAGNYQLRVVGHNGKTRLTDSLSFVYQSRPWGKAHRLRLTKINEAGGVAMVEASLEDSAGTRLLDSRAILRFGINGDGSLVDNQGTSGGSRVVQLYNGRATIRIRTNKGKSMVSASVENIPAVFTEL
ncbi:MAG: glycoside hydrolase family 2 protein [Chitinophagaceae bacterium]|nr:MAG: glycoside hydrolase family 2 protein [Chitinophagaceae bacterium]